MTLERGLEVLLSLHQKLELPQVETLEKSDVSINDGTFEKKAYSYDRSYRLSRIWRSVSQSFRQKMLGSKLLRG